MEPARGLVAGHGVSIVELDRFTRLVTRHPQVLQRYFTDAELAWCKAKDRPLTHLALRLAAKLAVRKTLMDEACAITLRDIETVADDRGRPFAHLHGNAAQRAVELGFIETHLSLSYTHENAVASAVALTADAPPRNEEQDTPDQELARTFHELRGMLDTIAQEVDVPGDVDDV